MPAFMHLFSLLSPRPKPSRDETLLTRYLGQLPRSWANTSRQGDAASHNTGRIMKEKGFHEEDPGNRF
jgi:hypothetical protein